MGESAIRGLKSAQSIRDVRESCIGGRIDPAGGKCDEDLRAALGIDRPVARELTVRILFFGNPIDGGIYGVGHLCAGQTVR